MQFNFFLILYIILLASTEVVIASIFSYFTIKYYILVYLDLSFFLETITRDSIYFIHAELLNYLNSICWQPVLFGSLTCLHILQIRALVVLFWTSFTALKELAHCWVKGRCIIKVMSPFREKFQQIYFQFIVNYLVP